MSRRSYECFKCRDNGFPNTMVYLAGKDEQGKTVYIEEDGTANVHKQQQAKQNKYAILVTKETKEDRILNLLENLNTRMNRIIGLLEGQK